MNDYQYFLHDGGKKSSWFGFIGLALILIFLFFIFTSLIKILYWASPVFLVLALIFDHKVVLKFGKMIWRLLTNKPILGVLAMILSVATLPIVTGGMLLNAFMNWRIRKTKKKFGVTEQPAKDEYSEFELVDEGELDLKEMEKKLNELEGK